MIMKVGIDAMGVYVPKLYLDLTKDWAVSRAPNTSLESINALRGKVDKGIGIQKISIPDHHEDSVTMAANAVVQALENGGINIDDVGSIIVSTESSIDQSKPISAYLLGLLESYFSKKLNSVSCSQIQFACIGSTYAVENGLNALLARTNGKPYQIVVSTEHAIYPMKSAGESTQGAGAVALILSEDPRLVEIDPFSFGTCTKDESDFYRPNISQTPVVDGKRSISIYCDCAESAFKENLSKSKVAPTQYHHFLFHVPFPKMAEYGLARIHRVIKEQLGEIEKTSPDDVNRVELMLKRQPEFKASLEEQVNPSLILSRSIGNIYSGSLYLSLYSLLHASRNSSKSINKQHILMTAYGSGSCAKVFNAQFSAHACEELSKYEPLNLDDVCDGGKEELFPCKSMNIFMIAGIITIAQTWIQSLHL
ncbi:hydroxymethylglutaryl-CoA synthase family protein [Pseudoalteromonas piscicida]|uniref:hydroxymethylglutaryl-CoA synthase family protein n=1 Tax=Pseudoalteromonas piscicida TaxID=43662 RepID=UPI000E35E268|nr:hydroxymethylglutaryl-CoA synthase [Pseudoalteromonas piscicida]AXQ99564.1 hydroxymethylglutaryl-CoA synthase family protein [Pseudoalteromonas piscicida]